MAMQKQITKGTPYSGIEKNVLKKMEAGIENGGQVQEVYHTTIESSDGPLMCIKFKAAKNFKAGETFFSSHFTGRVK